MRSSLPGIAVAVVLTTVVAACSGPNSAPNSAPNGGRSSPVDGVWRTDGYGWVIAVRNGQAETYDMTSLSCLPNRTLTQLDQPGPDGSVQFGDEHGAVEAVRRTPDGQGALRLLGTAADIDLISMPELPAMCTRPVPADPITTFDVFWATFAENYNSTVRKNVDWNAVRDRYRPMVNANTTPDELYQILVDMIEPLGDAHAALEAGDESFAGKREGTRDEDDVSRQDATDAVDEHLRRDIGVSDIQTFANNRIAYADLPGGIGYLRLTSFDEYAPDDNRFPANSDVLARTLDSIFT
jgi:Tricorn protease C1 domain